MAPTDFRRFESDAQAGYPALRDLHGFHRSRRLLSGAASRVSRLTWPIPILITKAGKKSFRTRIKEKKDSWPLAASEAKWRGIVTGASLRPGAYPACDLPDEKCHKVM
jgi:hypothetical protein